MPVFRLMPARGDELDEDAIYRQVGRLVVFFQALEAELLTLASFAIDPDNVGVKALPALSKLRFGVLVGRTGKEVAAFTAEHRGDVPAFQAELDALLDRCRELARVRNKVVHSAYVMLEGGGVLRGIVRADKRPATSTTSSPSAEDFEYLDEASFDATLVEIADVVFGIAQCRVQLVHWHARSSRLA